MVGFATQHTLPGDTIWDVGSLDDNDIVIARRTTSGCKNVTRSKKLYEAPEPLRDELPSDPFHAKLANWLDHLFHCHLTSV